MFSNKPSHYITTLGNIGYCTTAIKGEHWWKLHQQIIQIFKGPHWWKILSGIHKKRLNKLRLRCAKLREALKKHGAYFYFTPHPQWASTRAYLP